MNLDDFKPQWQQRQRDLDGSVDHVVKRVRSRMSSFDRTIWWRDMRESIAAVALIIYYIFCLFRAGNNWLWICGTGICILACIFIIGVLHWARRKGKAARNDLPVKDYCKAELTRVDRQIWLLRNVHWWYLGPLFIAIIVQVVAVTPDPSGLVIMLTFMVALFGFIYWLNQWAVKRQLLPLRRELTDAMDADGQIIDAESSLPQPITFKRRYAVVAIGSFLAACFLCVYLLINASVDPDAPRVSPFTAMRFESRQVLVTFQGDEYQWLEVDGIKVEDIVAAAKGRFWGRWQKRVSEDLVDVLWGMDHRPGETVALRLLDIKTNEERFVEEAPMTRENRSTLYWNRILAERESANQRPDELKDERVRDLVIDRELRARLEGRYEIHPTFIFDVQDRNGHLMIGITNQPTQEVFPDSATRWSYRSVDAMLEFKLGPEGPAKRLILHQNDMQQSAARIDE